MTADILYDLVVVGGGVNGCGVARDAAGRGASVVLFEQGDLAGATSSASTKLIHGGLRYLEQYEFRLVRESLMEREVLWAMAPHLIQPLRFVLPHHQGLRPRWMLWLGLFLYDHLGGRKRLPPTRGLDLRRDPAGAPLDPRFTYAFEYSDCWVDDARLVVLNALDAAERGATIHTRAQVTAVERLADHWRVTATTAADETITVRARSLVNAAGPWVERLVGLSGLTAPAGVRLVRGSHIVTRKLFDHDRAYIFQNGDGRIIFAIPYEHDFTLIGTTDADHHGDPRDVAATDEEVAYLCAAASEYFKAPVQAADVVWRYAGVRPLLDDGASDAQEATRDYVLSLDAPNGAAPGLSIFGGKITTYRRLSEAVFNEIAPHLGVDLGPAWTRSASLPGGDLAGQDLDAFIAGLAARYPFLEARTQQRMAKAYGARIKDLLADAASLEDMGRHFGADLYEREVRYLIAVEWARTAQDILWRRSKLGLRLDADQAVALDLFMRTASKL
ncbi:MAG: glycerol-3-phosphate dehydrogenase [bacterium]|nr:glycerol-3-phosphate dehydrogenase [bacterium]